jgi:hypothetical protein
MQIPAARGLHGPHRLQIEAQPGLSSASRDRGERSAGYQLDGCITSRWRAATSDDTGRYCLKLTTTGKVRVWFRISIEEPKGPALPAAGRAHRRAHIPAGCSGASLAFEVPTAAKDTPSL